MADSRAAYDEWHAGHHTGESGPWYAMVRDLLSLKPELLADARVLEIGCGGGDFCVLMASRGAREVIGEDFSEVAIQNARSGAEHPAVRFAVGDIEHINHEDGVFDVVLSCETIEHVPHPALAVRELARVLRPGGTLLLSTPNYLSLAGVYRAYVQLSRREWDEGGQPFVNWTMYPRTWIWVRRAGLKVRSTRGDGWVLPSPRRAEGIVLTPPPRLRPWVKLLGRHVLIEAVKADA